MAGEIIRQPVVQNIVVEGRRAIVVPVARVEQGGDFAGDLGDAGAGQLRIEFRVAGQAQFLDHATRQFARGQNLDLVLQGGGVAGQLRQHGGNVGDIVLALIHQNDR